MMPRPRSLPLAVLLAVLPLALAPLAGCARTASTADASPVIKAAPSSSPASTPATPVTAPAGRGTAQSGPQVFLAEGGDVRGTTVYRPACRSGCPLSGDGTTALWNMNWTAWDATQADGTGTEKLDDCNPNCAAGTLHAVAVRVALSNPVLVCAAGKGTWYWTRVIFTWPDGLPAVFSGDNAPTNPFDYQGIAAQQATSCA